MITTDAWILRAGADAGRPRCALGTGDFALGRFSFPDLADDELLVEPLFGCWEGNMPHALHRRPIDVCRERGEASVVIGNAGVVRVLRAGPATGDIREGDVGLFAGAAVVDRFGYTVRVHGYDAPGTVGLLAKRSKLNVQSFVRLPPGNPYSYEQWAAFSVRYITAWSNWRLAYGAYRLQISADDDPAPHVWGWGGGTTFAELDLARRHGAVPTMICGDATRRAALVELGIGAVDRARFPDIEFDERRYAGDAAYRAAYTASEHALLACVEERTRGAGVAIFVDYIGGPVLRATLKALGRQGVLCSAGWKLGAIAPMHRAIECIKRHVHVYTHYARRSEWREAVDYALTTGWMPAVTEVYAWDEVPLLAARAADSAVRSYFPVFSVNAP